MRVGPREATEIPAVAETAARHEETHAPGRTARRGGRDRQCREGTAHRHRRAGVTTIWDGAVTTISGVPRKSSILPETQIRLSLNWSSGAGVNLPRFSSKITTVNVWFGNASSRLRKVGLRLLLLAQRALLTTPHTVACSPMWAFASAVV